MNTNFAITGPIIYRPDIYRASLKKKKTFGTALLYCIVCDCVCDNELGLYVYLKAVCLVCKDQDAVIKDYNLSHHYEAHVEKYMSPKEKANKFKN